MYCDQDDLIKRFGENEIIDLTDRERNGSINVDVALSAIDDAKAKIDGYISGRVTLPLIEVPPILKLFACDMARYYLYDESPTDVVKTRYEEAIAFLKDVSKGSVSLGINDSGSTPESNDLAMMESSGSVFGRSNSKDFI